MTKYPYTMLLMLQIEPEQGNFLKNRCKHTRIEVNIHCKSNSDILDLGGQTVCSLGNLKSAEAEVAVEILMAV